MAQTGELTIAGESELYRELYRAMVLIRGFEELIQSLFLKGEIYGTTHLYSGQEAVATGVASLLRTATESRRPIGATAMRSPSESTRRSSSTRCSAGRAGSTAAARAP